MLPNLRSPCAILLAVSLISTGHAQNDGLPVIDVHMHSHTTIWADERLCFPKPCQLPSSQVTEASELREAALREMRDHNVVLAVVSGGTGTVFAWTAEEPTFLTGLSIGDPNQISEDEVRNLIESGRVDVLGELYFQYEGIAIDDPSVDPYLALAHEFDIPVHVHVLGLGGSEDFPIHLGNPLRVAKVMRKYPGLRIYLENAGWPFADEVTSLMYQYPTVYADISTILHLTPRPVAYRYIKTLVENGLGMRLMYGSDQMIWPEVIGETIEAIQDAEFLSESQKRDILYNNAARFFRLSDETIAKHHNR